MMDWTSWASGVVSALIGGFAGGLAGDYLSKRQSAIREKRLSNAFWFEFDLIRINFSSHLSGLIDDYKLANKDSFTGCPMLDLTNIEQLAIELAATDKVLNKNERQLTSRLRLIDKELRKQNELRDKLISKQISEDTSDSKTSNDIKFRTALILVDTVQIIYYCFKISQDKEDFRFHEYSGIDDNGNEMNYAEFACKSSDDIEFDNHLWEKVYSQAGININRK